MSTYIGQGNQAINWHFRTGLLGSYQNKILYKLFQNHGVLNGDSSIISVVSTSSITIGSGLSLLITPINEEETIAKLDTMESYTLTGLTNINETKLIARYTWLNVDTQYVDFLTIEPVDLLTNDVVICDIIYTAGNITGLNFTTQTIAKLSDNMIAYTNQSGCNVLEDSTATSVQGYIPGVNVGNLAINTGTINTTLNVDLLGDGVISRHASHSAGDYISIADGTINNNLVTEFFNSNGLTVGNTNGSIPICNGILNTNLNAEYINGSPLSNFSVWGHNHSLDDIDDAGGWYKVRNVNANHTLSTSSIEDEAFQYTHQYSEPTGGDLTKSIWIHKAANGQVSSRKLHIRTCKIGMTPSNTFDCVANDNTPNKLPFSNLPSGTFESSFFVFSDVPTLDMWVGESLPYGIIDMHKPHIFNYPGSDCSQTTGGNGGVSVSKNWFDDSSPCDGYPASGPGYSSATFITIGE